MSCLARLFSSKITLKVIPLRIANEMNEYKWILLGEDHTLLGGIKSLYLENIIGNLLRLWHTERNVIRSNKYYC